MRPTKVFLLILAGLMIFSSVCIVPPVTATALTDSTPLKIAGSTFEDSVDPGTGKLAPSSTVSDVTLTYTKLRSENGNAYAHVPYQGTATGTSGSRGSGNYDRHIRMAHPAISYTSTEAFVIEADYRLHYVELTQGKGDDPGKIYCGYNYSGASNPTTQIQFQKISTLKNVGDTQPQTVNWGNVVTIDVKTGEIRDVTKADTAVPLKQNEWTRIRIVITLQTGNFSVYTNDIFYGTGKIGTGVGNYTIIENTLLLGKCNKQPGQYKTLCDEVVEKVDSSGVAYLAEKETTAVDDSEDITYVDIDNVLFRHVEQRKITLDGKEMLIPENSDLDLTPNGESMLFAVVNDGEKTYTTKESILQVHPGMRVDRYVISSFVTLPTAELRLGEPTGIRFVTVLKNAEIEHIINNTNGYTVKMGTIITQKEIVDLSFAFTREDLSVYGDEDTIYARNYADVPADPTKPYGEWLPVKGGVTGAYAYAGSIVNIKPQNASVPYVGRGYLEIYDDKGALVVSLYSDYEDNATSLTSLVEAYLASDSVSPALLSYLKNAAYLQ